MRNKLAVLMLLMVSIIVSLSGLVKAKTIPMTFENPGSKRLLKSESGNYYYFRSLPEKAMNLKVKKLDRIQIRAFATKSISKPQVIVILNKQKQAYSLVADTKVNNYWVYKSIDIEIPQGTETVEVLCYDRSMYFRSFYTVIPKPMNVKLPNLKVWEHGGIMVISHDAVNSSYYTFDQDHPMKFEVNNGRQSVAYIRAKLTDRSIPIFELYQDGKLVKRYQLTTKRTTKYKVVGIAHLSTGLRIELPENSAKSVFELRSVSGHLMLVKPVIQKK